MDGDFDEAKKLGFLDKVDKSMLHSKVKLVLTQIQN